MSDVTKVSQLKKRVDVTDEEMTSVLNVAIAEWVFRFERTTSDRGTMRWLGKSPVTGEFGQLALEDLPNFAEHQGLAMQLLIKLATDLDLVPELRIDNQMMEAARLAPCHVRVLRRIPVKKGGGGHRARHEMVSGVSAATPSLAICHAVCEVYQHDVTRGLHLEEVHRALFPARYLAAV